MYKRVYDATLYLVITVSLSVPTGIFFKIYANNLSAAGMAMIEITIEYLSMVTLTGLTV